MARPVGDAYDATLHPLPQVNRIPVEISLVFPGIRHLAPSGTVGETESIRMGSREPDPWYVYDFFGLSFLIR